MVLAVSRLRRRPQDIEWAIRRPASSTFFKRVRSRRLANLPDPDGRAAIWDNSNIAESYSGITTPLTFSFARRAYDGRVSAVLQDHEGPEARDRRQRRDVLADAGADPRPGLLQPAQLVSAAGDAARVFREPEVHGTDDGRARGDAGGNRVGRCFSAHGHSDNRTVCVWPGAAAGLLWNHLVLPAEDPRVLRATQSRDDAARRLH